MTSSSDAPECKNLNFPLPSIDPKRNLITRENFVWGVKLSGMSEVECPRFPITESSGDNRPICNPREDETTIYLA